MSIASIISIDAKIPQLYIFALLGALVDVAALSRTRPLIRHLAASDDGTHSLPLILALVTISYLSTGIAYAVYFYFYEVNAWGSFPTSIVSLNFLLLPLTYPHAIAIQPDKAGGLEYLLGVPSALSTLLLCATIFGSWLMLGIKPLIKGPILKAIERLVDAPNAFGVIANGVTILLLALTALK